MQFVSINDFKAKISNSYNLHDQGLPALISKLGKNTKMPDLTRNYCIFDYELVNKIVDKKEAALPFLAGFLASANGEAQVTEALYTLDRMIDKGVKGIEKLYPAISRFNDTQSPNIQVHLAGIYRKTQIPDGFGPLMKMMLRQTFYPNSPYFDPTEEIGGAILDYLRNASAKEVYMKQ